MTQRMKSRSCLTDARSARRLAYVLVTGSVMAAGVFAQEVRAQEARAQEAPVRDVPSEQAQTTPASPACSGVLCLFRSGDAPQAQPVVQPVPSQNEAAPSETQATEATPQHVTKPKPIKPTITIVADDAALIRLKRLAATLPKEKVKVVTGAHEAGDFVVTTALAPSVGPEKARLFTEQMHIVAGAGISSVADLKGKIVSFGPDKGASQAVARLAFASLGVDVKETPLEFDNALDGVSTGDVAAVVLLAPQPATRLATVSGLHLVSWPDAVPLPAGAISSTIEGAAYPGLVKPGETIRALGVDAVLTLSPSGARKPASKTFLTDLSQHSDSLSRHGFDLIKADLETRSTRRVASVDRR